MQTLLLRVGFTEKNLPNSYLLRKDKLLPSSEEEGLVLAGLKTKLKSNNAKTGGRKEKSSSNGLKTVPTPNAHSASGNGLLLGGAYQRIPTHCQREVKRGLFPPSVGT